MSAAKSYIAQVIVRPGYCTGPEHVYELEVNAANKHVARRLIMDAVLEEDKLVSRFLSITEKQRGKKKK